MKSAKTTTFDINKIFNDNLIDNNIIFYIEYLYKYLYKMNIYIK